jgi:hypothetical protein
VLLLLAALLAATPGEPDGGAVGRAAEDLAARTAGVVEPGKLALAVLAPGADGLREPVETALAGALARRGQSVVPLRGPQLGDPEGAARALGADLLLRVRASLSAGTLALAGEVVPTRPNFFLQRAPARAAGSRVLASSTAADDVARSLASMARPGPGALGLVPLADLAERVLALAGGTTEAGAVRLVAVTPTGVALLDRRGALLAFHRLPPPPPGPRVRDAAAVAAIGDFGAGRVGYAVAGRPEGEILSAAGDHLEPVGSLAAAPLASGGAGLLFGAFVPGRGVLADLLAPFVDPGARPRSLRELFGAAAAPRPGRVAFAALGTDFTARLLGPTLEPAAPDVPGVGAAFALADLDGGGEPELVASSALPGPVDRVRVLRAGARPAAVFESEPVEGALLAAAACDLTGDGLDDVVLAAVLPAGGTRLWLLTADGGAVR